MGAVANKAQQAASQITNSEAWKTYNNELKEWEETCKAMEAWELEKMKRIESPGCCCLSIYWCQMVGSYCELPSRLLHHLCCFALTFPCARAAGDDTLLALHNAAHAAFLQIYAWLSSLLLHNITSPCEPLYAYWDDVSLERPPKPQPPVGYDTKGNEHAEKAESNCCCGCCAVCEGCLKRVPQHSNRLFRSAFCSLSCHHSCHPALVCGPLCTEPGCCICCEGWQSRWDRWDREATLAKEKRTAEFYDKTGRARIGQAPSSAPPNAMGKPVQMAM